MAYTIERHNQYTDEAFCVVLCDGRRVATVSTTTQAFEYISSAEAYDRDMLAESLAWKSDRRDCYGFGEHAPARADV